MRKNRIYFTVNFLITITHAPQLIVVIIYTHNTETSSLKYKPKLHISLTQNTHISLCV